MVWFTYLKIQELREPDDIIRHQVRTNKRKCFSCKYWNYGYNAEGRGVKFKRSNMEKRLCQWYYMSATLNSSLPTWNSLNCCQKLKGAGWEKLFVTVPFSKTCIRTSCWPLHGSTLQVYCWTLQVYFGGEPVLYYWRSCGLARPSKLRERKNWSRQKELIWNQNIFYLLLCLWK